MKFAVFLNSKIDFISAKEWDHVENCSVIASLAKQSRNYHDKAWIASLSQ
jgi:hypothetical protein